MKMLIFRFKRTFIAFMLISLTFPALSLNIQGGCLQRREPRVKHVEVWLGVFTNSLVKRANKPILNVTISQEFYNHMWNKSKPPWNKWRSYALMYLHGITLKR